MQGKFSRPSNNRPALVVLIILVVLLVLLAAFLLLQIRALKQDLRNQRLEYEARLDAATAQTQPLTEPVTEPPSTEPPTTQPEPTEPPTTQPETTEPPTDETENTEPTPEGEAEAEPLAQEPVNLEPLPPVNVADQPTQLTSLMEACQVDFDQLSQKRSTQLVTVQASGNQAQVRFYTLRDGIWREESDLACTGHVGRNGITINKREGDGCTPQGLYSVGSAFYTTKEPRTSLDLFQITQDTYWVDDPESKFYNQRVEGTENKDWNSAEHMIDYSVYRYGFVVNYNVPVQKDMGSAIFFHIGIDSTAGCISVQEQMVLKYLRKLDKECNPCILLVDPSN